MSTRGQKASKLPPLSLGSLNHVSFLCASIKNSVKFYQEVLGFDLVQRPSSLDFEGAWLSKYGIGIHLLQRGPNSDAPAKPSAINPKDNHISFQYQDMGTIRKKLEDMGIEFVNGVVKDGNIEVHQVFFHDPDGNMIEICDCQKLPVLPLSSSCLSKQWHSSFEGK
ncbi:metallothiol transferase FosB-like [Phoenix dactylifera]|uniref:Metallothiol transferase FosB-like n=1 Tax=Phoenix dactylifera TaxID=42345 RepID=A0A8B7C4M7_PHODC|nr:metallothiol transferase FosB-like [Phoenix dactylifera]